MKSWSEDFAEQIASIKSRLTSAGESYAKGASHPAVKLLLQDAKREIDNLLKSPHLRL